MKRIVFFILFTIGNIYAITASDVFMYYERWYANTGTNTNNEIGGEIKIILNIIKSIDNTTILIALSEDFIPFDSFSINAEATYENGKYIFQFNDGWGNIVNGKLEFNENDVNLSMDCVKFTDLGKQHGRLYGGPFVLKKIEIE
jgi:hypothetical protein